MSHPWIRNLNIVKMLFPIWLIDLIQFQWGIQQTLNRYWLADSKIYM